MTGPRRSRRARAAAGVLVAVALLAGSVAAEVIEPRDFPNEAEHQRYRHLIEKLRCLVCQNQSLAESDADLAADLRREVYEMMMAGRDDDQIIDFLVQRYGDFVLYDPPFKPTTVALWVGPFVLLAGGFAVLASQVRRRARAGDVELDEASRRRVAELIGEDEPSG